MTAGRLAAPRQRASGRVRGTGERGELPAQRAVVVDVLVVLIVLVVVVVFVVVVVLVVRPVFVVLPVLLVLLVFPTCIVPLRTDLLRWSHCTRPTTR